MFQHMPSQWPERPCWPGDSLFPTANGYKKAILDGRQQAFNAWSHCCSLWPLRKSGVATNWTICPSLPVTTCSQWKPAALPFWQSARFPDIFLSWLMDTQHSCTDEQSSWDVVLLCVRGPGCASLGTNCSAAMGCRSWTCWCWWVWNWETGAAAGIKAYLADLFCIVHLLLSRKAQEREETDLVCNISL